MYQTIEKCLNGVAIITKFDTKKEAIEWAQYRINESGYDSIIEIEKI